MKVAYMFGGMNRGGAETIMLDMFRNWRNAPFSFIGIHRKGGAYRDAFYAAGPALYQLAPKRFGYVCYFGRLRRLLKDEGVTIVHTQHWLDCIYAYIATIGMKIRIVNTFHGFYSMTGLNGMLCRMSIRMADEVCFVSRYEQEWYQKQMYILDSKSHVIYNAVDFAKLKDSVGNIRIETSGIRLAMVGSFSPARNQLLICKALRLIPYDIDFYFIGAKNEHLCNSFQNCYDFCESHQMLNKVHFVGEQSNISDWLRNMDGFVFATLHDTFGIALVEAVAMGLPVVVSEWTVMSEICNQLVSPGVQMFSMNDEKDCADKIQNFVDNMKECRNVAKKNAILVTQAYSLQAYMERLSKIYKYYDMD